MKGTSLPPTISCRLGSLNLDGLEAMTSVVGGRDNVKGGGPRSCDYTWGSTALKYNIQVWASDTSEMISESRFSGILLPRILSSHLDIMILYLQEKHIEVSAF
jgi:hypothetical protein